MEISSGETSKEVDERKRRRVSNLILILWIITMIINMVAYGMAEGAMREGELGHLRSYLLEYMNVLLVYIISFIAGFLLSALIFYSIVRYGGKAKLYILGGVFFMLSGVFDLVAAYYTYQMRSYMDYITKNLPLIPYEDILGILHNLNENFAYYVNFYNVASVVAIGGAFLFFGISAIYLAYTLGKQLEQYIFTLYQANELAEGPQIMMGDFEQRFRSAISDIKICGIFYVLSGLCDISVIIPGFEGFVTYGFFLFLIGMYFEQNGYKKLQSLQISAPGGFAELLY